jgi:HAD superfamily phosphatase (TIGR01668 family)
MVKGKSIMLIKPYKYFESVTDISTEYLEKERIKALVLDVDNTLTLKKGEIIIPGVLEWLEEMKKADIKLIILSNAVPSRMELVSKKLGLNFVAYGMKPFTFGYFRAISRMDANKKNTAVIGDQLFTDIMGGNLSGIKTILVSPKEIETSFGFKIKRSLERVLLKAYKLPCNF